VVIFPQILIAKLLIMCFLVSMQINTHPSFKANHISTVQIKKVEPLTKTYANCMANFVELVSKQDLAILNTIERHWRTHYASRIAIDAGEYLSQHTNPKHKFYALTLQNDSFDTLSSNKVLGLAEITDEFDQNIYKLDYLQTKPTHKYQTKIERTYKNIGTRIVDEIKKICFDKPIMLLSENSAIQFYIKNGFVATEKPDTLSWHK